jgi:DNA-binding NtrC family response regulator
MAQRPDFIGSSKPMRQLLGLLESAARTLLPAMIVGETGTGKDQAARLLHWLSPRRGRVFIQKDLTRMRSEITESELFGHVKGAFTGAVTAFAGAIASADGGSLFLNEFHRGERQAQEFLLKALDGRGFEAVGDTRLRMPDVKFILGSAIAPGDIKELDEHLFYRLPSRPLLLPPLRERMEDFDALFAFGRSRAIERFAVPDVMWSAPALALMKHYDWPGNVRQLFGVITDAMTFARGSVGQDDVIECIKNAPICRDRKGETKEERRLRVERLLREVGTHKGVAAIEKCCTKQVGRWLSASKKRTDLPKSV